MQHTCRLKTALNLAVQVQLKSACGIKVLSRRAARKLRASSSPQTSHLCFSHGAAHVGERGTLLLCQVDSTTPLSPATLFDPLLSPSSTRPPSVYSHCSDLKLCPWGESSRQQRPSDTELWMNLSS